MIDITFIRLFIIPYPIIAPLRAAAVPASLRGSIVLRRTADPHAVYRTRNVSQYTELRTLSFAAFAAALLSKIP